LALHLAVRTLTCSPRRPQEAMHLASLPLTPGYGLGKEACLEEQREAP